MKNLFITLNLIFFINFYFAQASPYSKARPVQFEYKPLNLEKFAEPLAKKQAKYDQNFSYLQDLIGWINKIKSQTNEAILNTNLDGYYKTLKQYEKKDVSVLLNELKQISVSISEEINQYNKRINEKNDPNKYWENGNIAYAQNDFSTAIQNYNLVIKLAPEKIEAYQQRGMSNYWIKNYSNAITDLTVFIESNQNSFNSFLYRGWSYASIANYEHALTDMNKSIELNSNNAYSYYSRGHVLSELKQYEKAIEDYKQAIKIQPNFSMAYNNIAWVKFLQKQYSQALIFSDQAVKLDSKNSIAIDTRSEIKFNLNDYNGCISDANSALLLNPNMAN